MRIVEGESLNCSGSFVSTPRRGQLNSHSAFVASVKFNVSVGVGVQYDSCCCQLVVVV